MVYNKNSSKLLNLVLSSALILFYLADGANKFIQIESASIYANGDVYSESFSASIYFRFLYELIFLFFIYKFYDKQRGKGIMLLFALFVSFIIGQFIFQLSYHNPGYNFVYHIVLFNKYIFLFIIYYGIKDVVQDKRVLIKLGKLLESIYVINSLLIFIGVAFQITLFKSYFSMDYRYGFDGLIGSINEATLFYIIGISFLYFNYLNQNKGFWSLWICIIASLLMGAKAMYLFLFLLLLHHIIFRANLVQKIVSVTVFILGILAALPTLLSDKYSYLYDFFIYMYEKNGLLSTITSGRSDFVMTKFLENLNLWNGFNYFFGGTDQFKFYIEMDFFDSILYLGIIGTVILMVLYFSTFFKKMKLGSVRLFFCVSFFLVAFMAGHFFSSAVNALYFNIALLYIYAFEKNELKQFNNNQNRLPQSEPLVEIHLSN